MTKAEATISKPQKKRHRRTAKEIERKHFCHCGKGISQNCKYNKTQICPWNEQVMALKLHYFSMPASSTLHTIVQEMEYRLAKLQIPPSTILLVERWDHETTNCQRHLHCFCPNQTCSRLASFHQHIFKLVVVHQSQDMTLRATTKKWMRDMNSLSQQGGF